MKGALCVLNLPAGASNTSASFTTSQTIERFHVGMRPGTHRERLSISINGSEGIISDGDWNGFINNVPGPLWLVKTVAWGILVANGFILWRVLPELHRAWEAQMSHLQNLRSAVSDAHSSPQCGS